ncbi:hypothetical protein ABPG72_020740 [Tetrahymena utriculariae]
MSYNPFSITNLYDIKNRSQNNAQTLHPALNNYQNRSISPNTGGLLNSSMNGKNNGSSTSNYSNNYYIQTQGTLQNSNFQGSPNQNNTKSSPIDLQAPRQANSPLSHVNSSQIFKTQNTPSNHLQMQSSQIQNIQGLNGIPYYQNLFQQTKNLNSSNAYQQNGYVPNQPQNVSQYNFSNTDQYKEKSPMIVNNANDGIQYNMSQANQSVKKIPTNNIQNTYESQTPKPPQQYQQQQQVQQATNKSLSPLNRSGQQNKYSNMNFTNYASTNKLVNQNNLQNPEEKNKLINQSQQFGKANHILSNQNAQYVNQSLQGLLTNYNTSSNQQLQQNNYTNGLKIAYPTNAPSNDKGLANMGGLKSARNVKEQIKQIGNTISTTFTSSKNLQAPQTQRAFKTNETVEDNSNNRLLTSPASSSNINQIQKPITTSNGYSSNFKSQTPTHSNNPTPASIPANLVNNSNSEIKKNQQQNLQVHSTDSSFQNKANEQTPKTGNHQFSSDQKPSYQSQFTYMSGMNKSASNSRNISPQNISVNLSTNNLSNAHTPRTQSKNNSQTGLPTSITQQLFSRKLQEQRQVAQPNVPSSQIQLQIQSTNINLTSQQSQIKSSSNQKQESSPNSSNSITQSPDQIQNYQPLSNQSSSHNLGIQTQSQVNNSGNKSTSSASAANQSTPTIQNQPSLTSEVSSSINQTNSNIEKVTQVQFDPNANSTQNLETEVYVQTHTTQDIYAQSQSQNFQQWWAEKRNINLHFISCAKLNKHQECIGYLDKKRGEMRAEINFKDEEQNTALHYAAQNGNAQLVNFLLFNEANIDSQNKQLITPLMFACKEGHEDVCQLLITAGADINNFDSKENTALHYASINGHKKVVDILLRKPSLFFKKKNLNNQEAYQLAGNDEVKKAFENFFQLQKQLLQSQQKLQIHDVQSQNVQQMFQKVPKSNNPEIQVENKSNGVYKKTSENDNKSSINEKTSTSDESKSSFGAQEEKVGPSDFIVHGLIGKGSFGEVYLVEKKGSQMLYAMKVLHKSKIIRHNLTKYAMTERNVMSLTNHPFIVKLNYAFQTSDKLFLIMDYCPGGDLGEHLQKEKKFSEELVKIYLAETILALEDLHKRDVIFRDLKPDNIVLDYEGHVKLTDFGLSKEGVLDHSSGARSFCGSVAYLAPEMLKRCGHGKAVDWYLLGVVMYELLVGIPPYYANNRDELFYNIEKAPLKIPSYLSNEARSLLKALLQRNPAKRLGSGKGDAEEIKAHPFFGDVDWNVVYQRKLKPPRPNRKIRISTKFDPNLFSETDYKGDKDYIAGWSFVSP